MSEQEKQNIVTLGTVSFLKEYDKDAAYNWAFNIEYPIVTYKGASYIAIDQPEVGQLPDENPKVWQLLGKFEGGGDKLKFKLPLKYNETGEVELELWDYAFAVAGEPENEYDPPKGSLIFGDEFLADLNNEFDNVENLAQSAFESAGNALGVAQTAVVDAKDAKKQADLAIQEIKDVNIDLGKVRSTAETAQNTAKAAMGDADIALDTANKAKAAADKAIQKITPVDTSSLKLKIEVGAAGEVKISGEAAGGSGSDSVSTRTKAKAGIEANKQCCLQVPIYGDPTVVEVIVNKVNTRTAISEVGTPLKVASAVDNKERMTYSVLLTDEGKLMLYWSYGADNPTFTKETVYEVTNLGNINKNICHAVSIGTGAAANTSHVIISYVADEKIKIAKVVVSIDRIGTKVSGLVTTNYTSAVSCTDNNAQIKSASMTIGEACVATTMLTGTTLNMFAFNNNTNTVFNPKSFTVQAGVLSMCCTGTAASGYQFIVTSGKGIYKIVGKNADGVLTMDSQTVFDHDIKSVAADRFSRLFALATRNDGYSVLFNIDYSTNSPFIQVQSVINLLYGDVRTGTGLMLKCHPVDDRIAVVLKEGASGDAYMRSTLSTFVYDSTTKSFIQTSGYTILIVDDFQCGNFIWLNQPDGKTGVMRAGFITVAKKSNVNTLFVADVTPAAVTTVNYLGYTSAKAEKDTVVLVYKPGAVIYSGTSYNAGYPICIGSSTSSGTLYAGKPIALTLANGYIKLLA